MKNKERIEIQKQIIDKQDEMIVLFYEKYGNLEEFETKENEIWKLRKSLES